MGENNEIVRSAANTGSYKKSSIKGGEYYYPDSYLTNEKTLEQFLKDNDVTLIMIKVGSY